MAPDESEALLRAESLYSVLGVAPGASQEAIVRAYRRQARAFHPDAHPEDLGAASRFKTLTSAYEVLSHPARRAAYDRRRPGVRGQAYGSAAGCTEGGENGPDVATRIGSARPSGSLWVGPVRVEAAPHQPLSRADWPHALPRSERPSLESLLLRFLMGEWST